jgi:hypothetical protein
MTITSPKALLELLGNILKQTEPAILVPCSWLRAVDRMLDDLSAGHDERSCGGWDVLSNMVQMGAKDDKKARTEKCGTAAISLLMGVRAEEARTGGCIPTQTFYRLIIESCGLSDMLRIERSGPDIWVLSNLEAEEELGLFVRAKVLDQENTPSYDAFCYSSDRGRDCQDELDDASRSLAKYLQRLGVEDSDKLSGDDARRFAEIFDKVQVHRKRARRMSFLDRA